MDGPHKRGALEGMLDSLPLIYFFFANIPSVDVDLWKDVNGCSRNGWRLAVRLCLIMDLRLRIQHQSTNKIM